MSKPQFPRSYTEAKAMLKGKPRVRLCDNTSLHALTLPVSKISGIAVQLHATDVVIFWDDGTLSLDSGGWLTPTTKRRINQCMPWQFKVFSASGEWSVMCEGSPYKFYDGMSLIATKVTA